MSQSRTSRGFTTCSLSCARVFGSSRDASPRSVITNSLSAVNWQLSPAFWLAPLVSSNTTTSSHRNAASSWPARSLASESRNVTVAPVSSRRAP